MITPTVAAVRKDTALDHAAAGACVHIDQMVLIGRVGRVGVVHVEVIKRPGTGVARDQDPGV